MLHMIAFFVIGVVVGAALLWGRQPAQLVIGIIGGLIGSYGAGLIMYHHGKHKILSLVLAIIGSLIVGFIARAIATRQGQSR